MARKTKASQTEAAVNSSAATAAEPSILDGSLASIANEPLAHMVIEGVQSARITAEALTELRTRFTELKKKETILGYAKNQWERFCKEKLGMTLSKARRWIRETCEAIGVPTPAVKHDGSKNRNYEAKNSTGGDDGRLPAYNIYAVTPCGMKVSVAKSAAIKAIRDGNEKYACFWIRQLYFATETVKIDVWKLLHIRTAEDVGLGDLSLVPKIKELEENYKRVKDTMHSELLPLMLATVLLCRVQKSRVADEICIWFNENPTWTPPLDDELAFLASDANPEPQYAKGDKIFDKHTPEGKELGRGLQDFLDRGAVLANKSPVVDFQP